MTNRLNSKITIQPRYKLTDYDYDLPPEFIAQYPAEARDLCKLMCIDRKSGKIAHAIFNNIIHYLRPDDVLVINNTRVFPARILGNKKTGAKIEVLLLRVTDNDNWEALVKPGRRFRKGDSGTFANGKLEIEVIDEQPEGVRLLKLSASGAKLFDILDETGHVPLPPYIERPDEFDDRIDYQTVYAKHTGSVAAPTAGLHFTDDLLRTISGKEIKIVPITLHVGLDTFRPVSAEDIREHKMHSEYYSISEESARQISSAQENSGRIIAVGTTTVRTLESASQKFDKIQATSGWSKLFIYPGYQYRCVDAIITNFHLPKSSLLMMIAAFWPEDDLLSAYQKAIAHNYRFYSYGDAMFIY